ncbi:MAG: M13 family metallopeptidase [Rhodospirillaceae bacterium]
MLTRTRLLAAAVALFSAHAAYGQDTTLRESSPGKPAIGAWGVDLALMDKSVAPGDNFFRYVNGGWLKTAEIPPDRSRTGSFDNLVLLSESRMQALADGLLVKSGPSAEERKLRDLYESYLDQRAIDAKGISPAKADFDRIAALKTPADLAAAFGAMDLPVGGPFSIDIDVNDKDPSSYVVWLRQAGLGMPDRDYYLRDDKEIAATREAYKKYIATMLGFAGIPDAAARAGKIYDLERRIAEVHWPNADRRNQDKAFNLMTVRELKAYAPEFPWSAYLAAAHIPETKNGADRQLAVAEKTAFPLLAKIFAETPPEVWRDYMVLHYLRARAAYLPTPIDDANFAFTGTVIQGTTQQLARKIRAVRLLDRVMGEALGKLYVEKYFPPEAKTKAEALVANLQQVFDANIRVLPWMTKDTRQKALVKLHKFTAHIGYPDTWRDYSTYEVKRDDLLGNLRRAAVFEWNRKADRLDRPVDRGEWYMTPSTVNAYYVANFNSITFPAAILQPPFFDPNADDAVNYGGIGAVIGHEMSHGFDDQGSKFDGDGAYANWWTPADRSAFDASTAVLGKQYDAYTPLPGLHVNGAFTMGENIADLSGLSIAFKAYHLSLGNRPAPVRDGFTGDQRFFLAFGQIWRAKMRDGALRQQVLSNPHSPSEFRAIGPTRNIDAWYDAFGIKAGANFLEPGARVRLW